MRLDDRVAKAMQMGFIAVKVEKIGKMNKICITNVLQVPKLQISLFLITHFLCNGLKV